MPDPSSFMEQAIIRNNDEQDLHQTFDFHNFFNQWLVEQSRYLEELVLAAKQNKSSTADHSSTQDQLDNDLLRPKIERVIQHYEVYYQTKSRWANDNILSMFNPSWRSSLEDAFMWIGGWRPSMSLHLLYSKSGLQMEEKLEELIQGLSTGDLGDLSQSQVRKVDELQKETIKEEKEISEELAKQQETVADSTMVELSHAVTEIMREGDGRSIDDENVNATLAPKEEALKEVLQRADDLRLKTLKEVVNIILSPIQSVHFLIAAAELHLRLHDWGKKRDDSWQGPRQLGDG